MSPSWLILLLFASTAGGDEPLVRAERALHNGRPARAAEAFHSHLDTHPDDPQAGLGLARAFSQLGRCRQAVALLDRHDLPEVMAHTIRGDCLLRAGGAAGAAAEYAQALQLDPWDTGALLGAALAASTLDDRETLAALLPRIGSAPEGDLLDALVAAQWAFDQGSERVDARLAVFGRMLPDGTGPWWAVLDARRWLALDDPVTAEQRLGDVAGALPGTVRLLVWRAEALRRLGAARGALELLERPIARRLTDDLHATAVRARLHADIGEIERARELLAPVRELLEPEVIASAWYVARAGGDAAEAERQARRWEQGVQGSRGSLEFLVPLHLRGGP